MRLRAAILVPLVLNACALSARQFLPRTGAYAQWVEVSEESGHLGREDERRMFIVTDDAALLSAFIEIRHDGAGTSETGRADHSKLEGILMVEPDTGNLVGMGPSRRSVLLPRRITAGTRWRSLVSQSAIDAGRPPGELGECVIEGRIDRIRGDSIEIGYDLLCGHIRMPYWREAWRIGQGQVAVWPPDGGYVVRLAREPK